MSQTQLQFVYRRKCESDKSQLGLGDHESNSTVTEVNFSDFLKKPFTKGHQGMVAKNWIKSTSDVGKRRTKNLVFSYHQFQ